MAEIINVSLCGVFQQALCGTLSEPVFLSLFFDLFKSSLIFLSKNDCLTFWYVSMHLK